MTAPTPTDPGMSHDDRKALCERIMKEPTSSLYRHAQYELSRLGEDDDEIQAAMNRGLLELVLVFDTHGHSGFSANYAINMLRKLLKWEPITPLTGEDSEWVEVGSGTFQNRRCSRVFKDASRFGGQAYDIDGMVFRYPNGNSYTSVDSFTPVTFPYLPTTTYVDVPDEPSR